MEQRNLSFWVLTALVTGNMVGSGIFMLPRTLTAVASPAGVLLAWIVTGAGVLVTALVFGNLALRKPNLNGGPQIYAKELFPKNSNISLLSGFISTWGYWIGNFAGNVAIITTFASYLSTFFPILTSKAHFITILNAEITVGQILTFLICTAMLWFNHFIVFKGIEGAGKLNFIATAAKVLGFFLFIIVSLFAFQKANIMPFVAPRMDDAGHAVGLFHQIKNGAIATLWAFIGIESAIVFASRAKRQEDVKKATITGLLIALAIYIGISMLVMGVLTQDQLIHSEKPLVDAMNHILGPIGSYLLAALGLISLTGSTLGWVLLSAEVPYQAAKQGLFLQAFSKVDEKGLPKFSLVVTNSLAQLFIFSTISNSIAQAYDFIIYVATLSYLIPYLISSVFQLKLVWTKETYHLQKDRITDGIISVFATLYSIWVIMAGTSDMKTFLLGVGFLVSGVFFYPKLKTEVSSSNADYLMDATECE